MDEIMRQLVDILNDMPGFKSEEVEPVVLNWITNNGYHTGNVMNAFRLTVVGSCKGPHMFDIIELIGREETIARLLTGIERINAHAATMQ